MYEFTARSNDVYNRNTFFGHDVYVRFLINFFCNNLLWPWYILKKQHARHTKKFKDKSNLAHFIISLWGLGKGCIVLNCQVLTKLSTFMYLYFSMFLSEANILNAYYFKSIHPCLQCFCIMSVPDKGKSRKKC